MCSRINLNRFKRINCYVFEFWLGTHVRGEVLRVSSLLHRNSGERCKRQMQN